MVRSIRMDGKKILIQRIGLVGVTNLLLGLSEFILLPILTKNLSLADYGIWAQVIITTRLIPKITSFGLPQTILRYYPTFKNKVDFQDFFYSSLAIILLLSGIAGLLLYYFKVPVSVALFDGNVYVVKILALFMLTESVSLFLISYFQSSRLIKINSFLNLMKSLLKVIVPSYFAIVYGDINKVVFGFFISSVCVLILGQIMVIREIGFKFPKFHNFNNYVNYSLFTLPANISYWIINSSDRYVISLLLGAAAVGSYSSGYTLGNIIYMIVFPINFILPLMLANDYESNNYKKVNDMFSIIFKYYIIVTIPAVFGISILSKPLLNIITNPEISEKAYIITPFIALSMFLYGVFLIMEKAFFLEKNSVTIAKILVVSAFINVALNFILLPLFGYLGAAISTLVSFFYMTASIAILTRRKINLLTNQNMWLISKVLLSSILMSFVVILLNPTSFIDVTISIVMGFFVYIIILVLSKVVSIRELRI